MSLNIPRIAVSAISGSSAKTLVSLGLLAVWRDAGRHLTPFKKGPDYIDAAWLTAAAGVPCRNLDVYLMGEDTVRRSFMQHSQSSCGALIEGSRGLFDGVDSKGTTSTAELAKLLQTPVILILDCAKMTGTAAAVVKGCRDFSPELNLAAVILNRVHGERHERVVRQAIVEYSGIPVLGCIPVLKELSLRERYLGLLPPQECGKDAVQETIAKAAHMVQEYLDSEALWKIAEKAPPLSVLTDDAPQVRSTAFADLNIGLIKDEAFQFYYPENIEALEALGARISEISALRSTSLGNIDALYLGGGFPEQFVQPLSANAQFRESVRAAAERDLPIYGECGGAMYLGKGIWLEGKFYPMAGVFPVEFALQRKPVGHGYTKLEVNRENPFFPAGTKLRGHEFHYSEVTNWEEAESCHFVFTVKRGYGFDGERDGLCYRNVLATYTHLHALGELGEGKWASLMLAKAKEYHRRN